ncbi:MAG: LysE family transporter [Thermoguttaceae bacterium]|nr:LysE family transporter [Thermoguttaceae bacterium]
MTGLLTTYASAASLGAGFGINGSISPGPMQTLLISETLLNGVKSSWRVAIISLVSDPIALTIAILALTNLPDWAVACFAFAGATVLFKIAWGAIKTKSEDFELKKKAPISFFQIWLANVTNPNLWIYSFTINGIAISEFWKQGGFPLSATYVFAFYSTMIACNFATAFIVGAMRRAFKPKGLVIANRVLGILMFALALGFVYTGITKVGLIPQFSL